MLAWVQFFGKSRLAMLSQRNSVRRGIQKRACSPLRRQVTQISRIMGAAASAAREPRSH